MDVISATDQQLTEAMRDSTLSKQRPEILSEIERRVADRKKNAANSLPFNPRIDISADARYLWKRIFIWFWAVPSAAFLIWIAVSRLR